MVVSADDYFQRNGYRFDPTELGAAHKACFKRYIEAVMGRKQMADVLIVDNTNIQLWEISPYVAVANAMDVPYEVVHIRCPVDVSIRRNVHHVPAAHIRRMARDFEPVPSFWPSITVEN
jgi:tRNA uridine 5-carbamoylmethylation protein Kti12